MKIADRLERLAANGIITPDALEVVRSKGWITSTQKTNIAAKIGRVAPSKAYTDMTKNELVRELNLRGIQHNKRWLRDQLLELLEQAEVTE